MTSSMAHWPATCHQCVENSLKTVKFKHKDPDTPSSSTALNLSLSEGPEPPLPAPPLTQVAVAHHIFGTLAQPSPHISDEVIELSHGQGDVVLVHVTVVSERLGDSLSQAPQPLRNQGSQKSR